MSQYVFGTGQLYTSNVDGSVPLQFGALQDVSVDFSSDIKQLFGQYQFPLDVARGKTKVEGKAATGEISAAAFNSFYFGQDANLDLSAAMLQAINEPGTVPAMSTYTITVDNDAEFYMDLGVTLADSGVALTQVAAMPASGQYSVSSIGVYTFNSAQASAAVLINYLYTGASGQRLDIGNQLMGNTPKFRLVLSQVYDNKTFTLVLYSCTAEKLSLPLKQDDYLISDVSFQAQTNAANQLGFMSTQA